MPPRSKNNSPESFPATKLIYISAVVPNATGDEPNLPVSQLLQTLEKRITDTTFKPSVLFIKRNP